MPQRRQRMPGRASALVLAVLAVLVAGCPAEDAPDEDTVAYCAQAAALDEQEQPPTDAQLESLRAASPAEIEPDVRLVADRYSELGTDAFGEPEVSEALERLEAWEIDNCPEPVQPDPGE